MKHIHSSILTTLILFLLSGLTFQATQAQCNYDPPDYNNPCIAVYHDHIEDVTIGDPSGSGIENLASGCGDTLNGTYTDNTGNISLVATISPGQWVDVELGSGTYFGEHWAIFIDFDHDGCFNDTTEFFYLGENSPGVPLMDSILIPDDLSILTLGTTRMRVMCLWNEPILGYMANADNLTFGETEDYNIDILPEFGDNLELVKVASPIVVCGSSTSELVKLEVSNQGFNVVTGFDVQYRFDGGSIETQSWSGTLNPLETATVTFFSDPVTLPSFTTYDLEAWIVYGADTVNYNDSILDHVIERMDLKDAFDYEEAFEGNNGEYTTIALDTNGTSWEWGDPDDRSYMWINATTNTPIIPGDTMGWITNPYYSAYYAEYNAMEHSYLLSPCFDFGSYSEDPVLRFEHIYEMWDTARNFMEISLDGGGNWSSLDDDIALNWYNDATYNAWSGNSGINHKWEPASIRLDGSAGESAVRLRWGFVGNGEWWVNPWSGRRECVGCYEGVGVDDIAIKDSGIVDIGISAILAPNACSGGTAEEVTVIVVNYGAQTVVDYELRILQEIDGTPVAPIIETFSDPILPFESRTVTFAASLNLTLGDDYVVSVMANLPGDAYEDNDLVSVNVFKPEVLGSSQYVQLFDDFEVDTWNPIQKLSENWINTNQDDPQDWAVNEGPTPSFVTGPPGDFPTGFGNYLYLEDSGREFDQVDLFSPCFDLEDTKPNVSFWIHSNDGNGANSPTNNYVLVDIFDESTASWVELDSIGHLGNFWERKEYSVVQFFKQIIRVRFRGNNNNGNFTHDIAIDSFAITPNTRIDAGAIDVAFPYGNSCGLTEDTTICLLLENFGEDTLSNIPVNARVDGGAVVTENMVLFPEILVPHQSDTFCFSANFDFTAPGDHDIEVWTSSGGDTVIHNDAYSTTITNITTVDSFPYFQDFETGSDFWEAGGTRSTWELGLPAKTTINSSPTAGDTMSWMTGGTGTGFYENSEDSWVNRRCFDLSSSTNLPVNPWVQLKIWWNAQFSLDGAVLQASKDNEESWITIGDYPDPYNWYNDNFITAQPGGQPKGWTGSDSTSNSSEGWVCSWHALPLSLIGQPNVIFRIAFSSDGSKQDDGIAFDEIGIGVIRPPNVNLGPDKTSCGPFNISAGDPSNEFNWSTGETTQGITVTTTGPLTVEVTEEYGCMFSDSMFATILAVPDSIVLEFKDDEDTLCGGGIHWIAAIADTACAYEWNNGSTTPNINVSPLNTTSYTVTCTNADGCTTEASATLWVVPGKPEADFIYDSTACPTFDFISTSTNDPDSITWRFKEFSITDTSDTMTYIYDTTEALVNEVTMIAYNGCGVDSITISVDLECIVAIDDDLSQNVSIYPNPNHGNFYVEFSGLHVDEGKIEVYDLTGKALLSQSIPGLRGNEKIAIDLADISKGLYFVVVRVGGKSLTEKLLVD